MNKAHWFSPDLFVESKQLALAAEDLLERLYQHSQPQRKHPARHLPQLEILILNLLRASGNPLGLLSISMTSGNYSGMERVSYRVLVEHHVNTLLKLKWLNVHHKGSVHDGGYRSRLQLMEPMLAWLKSVSIAPHQIDAKAPQLVLTLKNAEKTKLEIPPELTENAKQLSAGASKINDLLEKTFIDLFLDEYELEELQDRMSKKAEKDPFAHAHLDLTRKYLRRIFNNGSLGQGGRFYDGWWQSIPSEYRQYISLNGDYVVELDYSSIHIHLLYAQIQKTCRMEDHYVFGKLSREWRPVTKKMVNILINARSRESAVRAATDQELFKEGFPQDIADINEYIDEIYFHHDGIVTFFGTGYGVKLQFLDSQIAEGVMLRMLPEPCLPVHDSFIVRSGQEQKLEEVMNEEFQAATGVRAGIKTTVLELSSARKAVVKELIDDELSSYSSRLYRWRRKYQYRFFTEGGSNDDAPALKA